MTALAVASLALGGCSSGGGKKSASLTTTPSTAPEPTVAAGTPKQAANDGVTTPSVATTTTTSNVTLTSFKTPSGNIGCEVSADYTRCDIDSHTWSAPPKPASCQFDWGGGIQISGSATAEFACASDSVLAASSTVLAYGQSTHQGSMVCTSAEAGVTCTNEASHHGFFLSRDSYRIF